MPEQASQGEEQSGEPTAGEQSGDEFTTIENDDVVEVNVAVDTSEMTDQETEVLRCLADTYERNFRELYEKNRDYGWSFLTTGSKLAASEGTPFEHPSRSQAYGLLTRSGDKRERLIENVYGDGDAAVSDDPSTTAREAANYLLFLSFVLENPELASSFPEQ